MKVKVELKEYMYTCGDGCCTDYGTIVKVDGVELPYRNQDVSTILEQVLRQLGYEPEIINEYEYDT